MGTPGYFLILPCYVTSEFGLNIVYWSHRQTVIRVCPPAQSVTTESSKQLSVQYMEFDRQRKDIINVLTWGITMIDATLT